MLQRLRAFRQMTTYLGVVVIAVIWAGITLLASGERERANQNALRQGSNLAHVLDEYVSRVARGSDSALLALRQSYERDPQHFDLADWAERTKAHNDLNILFGIIDADGIGTRSSRGQLSSPSDLRDRRYFTFQAESTADELFISEPLSSRISGKQVIQFTRRLSKPDGSFDGVVLASIDVAQLGAFFSSLDLGRAGIVSLAGFDGVIRSRGGPNPAAQTFIGASIADTPTFKLFRKSPIGSYWNYSDRSGQFEGINRLISYRVVEGLPLIAIIGLAESDVFLQADATVRNYVLSGIVLTIIVLIAIGIGALHQAKLFFTAAELQRSKMSIEQTNLWFETALTNMSHGLCMFDGEHHLIVCNTRYAQMYGLPPQLTKPGTTLNEILDARIAAGTASKQPEHYIRARMKIIANREPQNTINELRDGRIFAVSHQPMADGGWVAIHQDVTEQKRIERALVDSAGALKESNARLAAVFQNMSQGVVMFDATARLVICNDRYPEMYGLSPEVVKPGCPLAKIFELRNVNGTFLTEDDDAFLSDLRNAVARGQTMTKTLELRDGRNISVVVHPMADGGWVATHDDVTEHRRREASFRLLFDNNPMPMWVFDRASLRFLAVNNAAVTHYGYSHRQFLAMSVLDIRPPEERSVFEQFLRALPAVQYNMDVGKHQRADGSKIDVSVYSQALRYEDHDARLAAIYDVTERKLTEDDLRRTRKFLDTIVENVPVPILVKDVPHAAKDARGCQYSLINRAAEAFFDISRGQIIGKTVEEVYPQDDAAAIIAENNETLRSGKPVETADHRVRRLGREQGTRIITSKSVAIRDDDGHARHLVTVIDDVTERRHAEERILQMAHRDNLTELPNRTAFSEFFAATLERAASGGEQFAVLSMDLDRFKEANDVYGHAIGDALLREVARRLRSAADGAFLARIGGDEFILFVTDGPQPAAATALAERLLAAFADDFEVEGQRLRIGLSIGGAVYPTDGTDAKTLMVNADAALYRAKAETRGSVLFFEPEMSARLRERHALQEDLRAAVARDELLLHYQPQVRMDGEIIGFEALVRWQCPKRGLVAPAVFIPVAEESTLIIPVGEWVLREACREAASWPLPLTIAVNISPIQFRHGDLPALVHSILLETGLAPGRLELEITEGIFINDFSHAVSILRRLKSLGVQIALDDFGTGYSSLSYLHSFSFDKIKIDRAFVGDLEYNRHSIAIVRAVINLGHSLNIPILAEGVETNAQRAFLLKDGCDQMQGYLTGRPLPIGAYADRICGASDAPLKIGLAH